MAQYEAQDAKIHEMLSKAESDHHAKRTAMTKAMMEENLLLAKEKKDKEARDREFELKMDKYTSESDQANPFFNEHFDKTQSQLAPHRYIPYNFKGLREDQKAQINLELQHQIKEAEYKKKQEEDEDKLWGIQAEHLRKLKVKQD